MSDAEFEDVLDSLADAATAPAPQSSTQNSAPGIGRRSRPARACRQSVKYDGSDLDDLDDEDDDEFGGKSSSSQKTNKKKKAKKSTQDAVLEELLGDNTDEDEDFQVDKEETSDEDDFVAIDGGGGGGDDEAIDVAAFEGENGLLAPKKKSSKKNRDKSANSSKNSSKRSSKLSSRNDSFLAGDSSGDDDDADEWEDVDDDDLLLAAAAGGSRPVKTQQKGGVEVSIDVGERKTSGTKRKPSRQELMIRELKKRSREIQVDMHKTHVLTLIAHMRWLLRTVVQRPMVKASVLSLIPAELMQTYRNPPHSAHVTNKLFRELHKLIDYIPSLENDKHASETAKYAGVREDILLGTALQTRRAHTLKERCIIFGLMLRAIGFEVRLVWNMQSYTVQDAFKNAEKLARDAAKKKTEGTKKTAGSDSKAKKSAADKKEGSSTEKAKKPAANRKSSKKNDVKNERQEEVEEITDAKPATRGRRGAAPKPAAVVDIVAPDIKRGRKKIADVKADTPSPPPTARTTRRRAAAAARSSTETSPYFSAEKKGAEKKLPSATTAASPKKRSQKTVAESEKVDEVPARRGRKRAAPTVVVTAPSPTAKSNSKNKNKRAKRSPSSSRHSNENEGDENEDGDDSGIKDDDDQDRDGESSKTSFAGDDSSGIQSVDSTSTSSSSVALLGPYLTPMLPSSSRKQQREQTSSSSSIQFVGDKYHILSCKLPDFSNGRDFWLEVYCSGGSAVKKSDDEPNTAAGYVTFDCLRGHIQRADAMEVESTQPMAYVTSFSFSENNVAMKDLTSRYASQWMTHNRRLQCDRQWWMETLHLYAASRFSRYEQVDEMALRMDLLKKPQPKSLSEVRAHPLYVILPHLKKYEAIWPADTVPSGYMQLNKKNPNEKEALYLRDNVVQLHARNKWIQQALQVKMNEQPYKIVKKWIRKKKRMRMGHDMNAMLMNRLAGLDNEEKLELFGRWQTEAFVPPVAANGQVPRNEYGNVELFLERMMPIGCCRLRLGDNVDDKGVDRVARKNGIDIARAMVGWDTHSGYSHPMFDGWIICKENHEKLVELWKKHREEKEAAENEEEEAEEPSSSSKNKNAKKSTAKKSNKSGGVAKKPWFKKSGWKKKK